MRIFDLLFGITICFKWFGKKIKFKNQVLNIDKTNINLNFFFLKGKTQQRRYPAMEKQRQRQNPWMVMMRLMDHPVTTQ